MFRFKFVKHHSEVKVFAGFFSIHWILKLHLQEDFYEIIACRDDGEILNDHLVTTGLAKPAHENPNFNVLYPSFELLEKSQFYETYSHRYIYKKKGINFNAFEEEFINPQGSYDEQLFSLLEYEKFGAIRKVFEMLRA